jgi:hypothetical protein
MGRIHAHLPCQYLCISLSSSLAHQPRCRRFPYLSQPRPITIRTLSTSSLGNSEAIMGRRSIAFSTFLMFGTTFAAQSAETAPQLYQPRLEWAAPTGWITGVHTTLIADPPYPENRVLISLWMALSDPEGRRSMVSTFATAPNYGYDPPIHPLCSACSYVVCQVMQPGGGRVVHRGQNAHQWQL